MVTVEVINECEMLIGNTAFSDHQFVVRVITMKELMINRDVNMLNAAMNFLLERKLEVARKLIEESVTEKHSLGSD